MKINIKISILLTILISFNIFCYNNVFADVVEETYQSGDYILLETIGNNKEQTQSTFPEYVSNLYKFAIGFVALAALLMITIGGFSYMTAAGNQAQVGTAKKIIIDAILGLIVVFISWLVLHTINPDLLNTAPDMGKLQEGVKNNKATSPKAKQQLRKENTSVKVDVRCFVDMSSKQSKLYCEDSKEKCEEKMKEIKKTEEDECNYIYDSSDYYEGSWYQVNDEGKREYFSQEDCRKGLDKGITSCEKGSDLIAELDCEKKKNIDPEKLYEVKNNNYVETSSEECVKTVVKCVNGSELVGDQYIKCSKQSKECVEGSEICDENFNKCIDELDVTKQYTLGDRGDYIQLNYNEQVCGDAKKECIAGKELLADCEKKDDIKVDTWYMVDTNNIYSETSNKEECKEKSNKNNSLCALGEDLAKKDLKECKEKSNQISSCIEMQNAVKGSMLYGRNDDGSYSAATAGECTNNENMNCLESAVLKADLINGVKTEDEIRNEIMQEISNSSEYGLKVPDDEKVDEVPQQVIDGLHSVNKFCKEQKCSIEVINTEARSLVVDIIDTNPGLSPIDGKFMKLIKDDGTSEFIGYDHRGRKYYKVKNGELKDFVIRQNRTGGQKEGAFIFPHPNGNSYTTENLGLTLPKK